MPCVLAQHQGSGLWLRPPHLREVLAAGGLLPGVQVGASRSALAAAGLLAYPAAGCWPVQPHQHMLDLHWMQHSVTPKQISCCTHPCMPCSLCLELEHQVVSCLWRYERSQWLPSLAGPVMARTADGLQPSGHAPCLQPRPSLTLAMLPVPLQDPRQAQDQAVPVGPRPQQQVPQHQRVAQHLMVASGGHPHLSTYLPSHMYVL